MTTAAQRSDLRKAAKALDAELRPGAEDFKALCIVHPEDTPSLHVSIGSKGLVVKCLAGCPQQHVWQAFQARLNGSTNGTGPKVRVTTSRDDEQPVAQDPDARRDPMGWLVTKTGVSPKFLNTLPISFEDGWIRHHFDGTPVTKDRQAGTKERRWTPSGTHTPPIWPLPSTMPEAAVFAEGETDCIALRGIGIPDVFAITGGAGHPPSVAQWAEMKALGLRSAAVALDADDAGRKGAEVAVANALAAGLEVTSITPPRYSTLTGAGKDWCDWVAAGGTRDTFPLGTADDPAKTTRDMLKAPPTQWRHPGYETVAGVNMLYGRPKSGKSTLEYARASAFERGDIFLGIPVNVKASTFFLTEEGDETIREKVEMFGLRRAEFLTYADAKARGWTFPESLAFAMRKCHAKGHRRLTIDTLATWAEVKDLNDSKEMLDAINAVRVACQGVTVTFVYHSRKAAGDHGDAILGASGIFAALDIATEVERDDKRRNIKTDSRYRDVPDAVAVELDGSAFVVVGVPRVNKVKRAADDSKDLVLARLRLGPVTVAQIVAEGVADLKEYQVAKYCRELVAAGKATSRIVDKQTKKKAYEAS